MVAALGGPAGFLDDFERHLRVAPRSPRSSAGRDRLRRRHRHPRPRPRGGRDRRRPPPRQPTRSTIRVGLELLLGLGASVEPDTPLARIHAADAAGLAAAEARIRAAYRIADKPAPEAPLVLGRIA